MRGSFANSAPRKGREKTRYRSGSDPNQQRLPKMTRSEPRQGSFDFGSDPWRFQNYKQATMTRRAAIQTLRNLLLDFCKYAELQPLMKIGAELGVSYQYKSFILERRFDSGIAKPDFSQRPQIS